MGADVHIATLAMFATERLQALIGQRCAEASEAVTTGFQAARVRFHLPPVLLDTDKTYRLPKRFVCPECGGRTVLEVYEWATRTGVPTSGGFTVHCKDEGDEAWAAFAEDVEYEGCHRYWQSYWQPLCDIVARWMVRNVRVRV